MGVLNNMWVYLLMQVVQFTNVCGVCISVCVCVRVMSMYVLVCVCVLVHV